NTVAARNSKAAASAAKYFTENIFRNFMSSPLSERLARPQTSPMRQLLTLVELRLFPLSPHRNIVVTQLIPPGVQHCLLALFDSHARYAGWRWHERVQAIQDAPAVRSVGTTQQMP